MPLLSSSLFGSCNDVNQFSETQKLVTFGIVVFRQPVSHFSPIISSAASSSAQRAHSAGSALVRAVRAYVETLGQACFRPASRTALKS